MPFQRAFELSSYLLVLTGFSALVLADLFPPPVSAALLLLILLSWWADRLHARIAAYKRAWDLATVAMAAVALLDVLYVAETFMAGILHLIVFIMLYKLFNRRTTRDYLDLYVLSFVDLVAASALTVSIAYFAAFAAYLALGTWTWILFHLRREGEEHLGNRVRDLLGTARVLTPAFLWSTQSIAVASLLITLAIFFLIPRVGRAYLPLGARSGPMATGFSDKVELGSFGTIQNDPTIAMRVMLPGGPPAAEPRRGLRWRGVAFDRFDGQAWTSEGRRTSLVRGREGIFFLPRPVPGTQGLSAWGGHPAALALGPAAGSPLGAPGRPPLPFAQEVFLEPIGTEVLFAAQWVVRVTAGFRSLVADGAGGIAAPYAPLARLRYIAVSQIVDVPEEQLRAEGTDYPESIRERYLQLPPLAPRVTALAREVAGDARTAYEKAQRIEAYLKSRLRYSLDLRRDPRFDPVEDFLFQQRSGNCEYFAASMAVMLRSLGVPARVVNGFQRGEWNEFGGYYAIRQRDAHAWVEVFFPQSGWITFDPSPRADFEVQIGVQTPNRFAQFFDSLRMRWNRYIIDYSAADQATVALALRRQSFLFRQNLGLTFGEWRERARAGLRQVPARALLGTLLLLGLAGALLARGRGLGRRAGRAPGSPRIPFYEQMLAVLARQGLPKPPHQTPQEFARTVAGRDAAKGEAVAELAGLYYRVRYGRQRLTAADRARLDRLLDQLRGRPGPAPTGGPA